MPKCKDIKECPFPITANHFLSICIEDPTKCEYNKPKTLPRRWAKKKGKGLT